MIALSKLTLPVMFGLLLLSASAQAADQETVLMLGGEFCEFYPKAITKALTAVKGVTGVDLKKMKGHAVVTHDAAVDPEALVEAMKQVKGDGWHCTAEIMEMD